MSRDSLLCNITAQHKYSVLYPAAYFSFSFGRL